jgi:UDP-glucose 4-epimerase
MRILVTGATGFIGRHLVADLAPEHEVVSLARSAKGPPGASAHLPHDLTQQLDPSRAGPLDAVIHLAGHGNVDDALRDPATAALLNAQTTANAVQLARMSNAPLVLASSQRVYRPRRRSLNESATKLPTEPYGYAKLAAELYVQMAGRVYGLPGVVLRMFSVYGPGQLVTGGQSGVLAIFSYRALEGTPLVVMSRGRKDFVEVADTVQAMRLALARPATPARAYNIGAGRGTSLIALARAVRAACRSQSPIVTDYAGDTSDGQVADIRRARQELGYEPKVTLAEGLNRYVEWLRSTRAGSA